jgi:2'-5' RNA ligase
MKLSLLSILEKLNITEKNKKKGRMIAIMIPNNIASRVQKAGEDAHDREIEEDEVNKSDMHITLGLVESGDNQTILKTLRAMKIKPFKVAVKSLGMFNPNKYNERTYVLHAKIDAVEIKDLHKQIVKELKSAGVKIKTGYSGGYKPHVTIKYSKKRVVPKNRGLSLNFTVDKLHLVDKTHKYTVRLS